MFVGGAYIGAILAVGEICTASFDPFHALCPALLTHFNEEAWIYYVGPLVGATTAAVAVWLMHLNDIHDEGWIKTPKSA